MGKRVGIGGAGIGGVDFPIDSPNLLEEAVGPWGSFMGLYRRPPPHDDNCNGYLLVIFVSSRTSCRGALPVRARESAKEDRGFWDWQNARGLTATNPQAWILTASAAWLRSSSEFELLGSGFRA